MLPIANEEKTKPSEWYKKGIPFRCTGCGKCCTGSPGYVWVTQEELEKIATYLEISLREVMKRYVRRVKGLLSLLEKKPSFDCVFLKDKQCQIYSVRPVQCQTFPWWPHLLSSPENWAEAALGCEGISENAPIVPYEEIEKQLSRQEGVIAPWKQDTSLQNEGK